MLYITTIDKNDVNTAYKALRNDFSGNGSCYVPFHLPCYTSEELRTFKKKQFGQIIADMINLFFSTELTGWDVDFALGRNIAKVKTLSGKTYIAELWHNAEGQYDYLVRTLYNKVTEADYSGAATIWFRVAVRIAVLFAIFYSTETQDDISKTEAFDICVSATGDLTAAAAVFYARKMGLPINNVVCVCDENSAVWEFIYRGICQRKSAFPEEMDCFVDSILGYEGVQAYLQCKTESNGTILPESILDQLRSSVFVAAVGQQRINSVMVGAYRTNRYVFNTACAMVFGGLQDYRASTGESRSAMIMMDTSPLNEYKLLTEVLGITKKELSDLI